MGKKTTSAGVQRVVVEKTTIARRTLYSHNWCDRTTWYTESVRVANEVATDSGDHQQFTLDNQYVIDTYHGKVTEEDYITDSDGYSYRVSVTVNDQDGYSEQDPHYGSGGEFTVNYGDGYIDFLSVLGQDDVVKVTYHYENGSMCEFAPATATESLNLGMTEIQFSTNVIFADTIVFAVYGLADVFAPGQFPPGTLIPLQNEEKFKSIMDFYNDSVRAYPTMPALGGPGWRGIQSPIVVLDWDYITAQTLHGAYGMKIMVRLEHDEPNLGDYATATFYFTVEE